ncbi:MAG: NAD(P)-dependent oxidoreductase [Ferruginibacter sp.]
MKKRILVTGGTGLIGSYLTDALLSVGDYEVFILGRKENPGWKDNEIKYVEIDLANDWNEAQLPEHLYGIIHLSQAENFRDFPGKAKETFYINTLSTLKLINYAVENKISHFIYASSGGVYGNGEEAFSEDQHIGYEKNTGFYIATKHCSEVVLENYSKLLNVFILRFFFVYGKGQNKNMLIPRLINFVKNEEAITLQGESGIKINPIYVQDAVMAILEALKINESHTINIGGPDVLSLKEIGEIIGSALKKEPKFIINQKEIPKNLIGNISKMKNLLYTPQKRFRETIETLI